MSSGSFLDKNNKPTVFKRTAVLLDNLTLRCRLVAGDTGSPDCGNSGERIHKHLGPEEWRGYFADPYIYPTYRSAPYLKVFGANTLRTNGKRVFRAEVGNPLPHHLGHDSKRRKLEDEKNQLDLSEIEQLEQFAKAKDYPPHYWLLTNAFYPVFKSRDYVKSQFGLESWNPAETVSQHVVVERLEMYFEVLTEVNVDRLTEALRKVLYVFLKISTKRRSKIEHSYDQEDLNSYMTWSVPQRKVDNGFVGKRDFKFKVYKKGNRVRIEFQANFPKLADPPRWDGVENPYLPVLDSALRTANILARTLDFIWDLTIKHFSVGLQSDALLDKIGRRVAELKPTKHNHCNARQVFQHLAEFRAITLADLTRFGWDRNDLKTMADPNFGFLKKQEMGFADLVDGVKPEQKKAIRGIYVLVPEWLDRSGRPQKKDRKCVESDARPIHDRINALLTKQRIAPGSDLPSLASGTAMNAGHSSFCTLAKINNKQIGEKDNG